MAADPDNTLRLALAHVLEQRFRDGSARGTKTELGALLSASENPSAQAVATSRLLNGELFPDQQWGAIADFVGLTSAGLLRKVADKMSEFERDPDRARPPERSRGRPRSS